LDALRSAAPSGTLVDDQRNIRQLQPILERDAGRRFIGEQASAGSQRIVDQAGDLSVAAFPAPDNVGG